MPLVSVIMPSYNHERFIFESIESVLKQSMGDLELIIIDDASSDSSRQIIEDYQRSDARVRVIFHDKNMGIARTMNDGLGSAQGKFIAFTASDDVWVENKIEKQLEVLKVDEDLVVWSEGEIIDSLGRPTGEIFTRASKRQKSGNIFEELLRGNFIFGSTLILSKRNLGDIKYDESLKYLNDYLFEVELALQYKYYFISEPLAKYRIHGGNTIILKLEECYKEEILIRQQFFRKYDSLISNTTKAAIYFWIGQLYDYFHDHSSASHFVMQSIRLDPYYFFKAGRFYLHKILHRRKIL